MSTASITTGRLNASQMAEPIMFDAPEATVRAMLTKQDEIIDKVNLILTAVEDASDGDTLFSQLDVAATKAHLSKLSLMV